MAISKGSLYADIRALKEFVLGDGPKQIRELIKSRATAEALKDAVPAGVLRFMYARAMDPEFKAYKEQAPEGMQSIFDEASHVLESLPAVPSDYVDTFQKALEAPSREYRVGYTQNTPSEISAIPGLFEAGNGKTHLVAEIVLRDEDGTEIARFEGTMFDLTFVGWSMLRAVRKHLAGELSKFGIENLTTPSERNSIVEGLDIAEQESERIRGILRKSPSTDS